MITRKKYIEDLEDEIIVEMERCIKEVDDLNFALNSKGIYDEKAGKQCLVQIFKGARNLSDEEKESLYDDLIQHYLELLSSFEIANMDDLITELETITFKFGYLHFVYGKSGSEKSNCFNLQDAAERVSNDLTAKCCRVNGRSLVLPITVRDIYNFCLDYRIVPEKVEKAILWIILRLGVAYFLFTER